MKINKNIFFGILYFGELLYLTPIASMQWQWPRIPRLKLPKRDYLEKYCQEIIHLDLPVKVYRHIICNSPRYSDRYGHWAAGWQNYSMCEEDDEKRARMLAMIKSRIKNKQDLHIPITDIDDRSNSARAIMNDAVEDDKFIAVTRKLLSAGINPNAICSSAGRRPLQVAFLNGAKETAKLLVKTPGIDVHIHDEEQHSLLHYALHGFKSKKDQYDVIELLLKAGLNPNSVSEIGQTVLFNFALKDQEVRPIILLMAECGLRVHNKNNAGEIALEMVQGWRKVYKMISPEKSLRVLSGAADIIPEVPKIQARALQKARTTYLSLLSLDILYNVFNRYHE